MSNTSPPPAPRHAFETLTPDGVMDALASVGLPGQLLSALPYVATILALVLLSLGRRQGGSLAPAALGRDFTPHR